VNKEKGDFLDFFDILPVLIPKGLNNMYIDYIMYMVSKATCVSMTSEDREFCKSKGIIVSRLLAQAIKAVKTEKFIYSYLEE
jgi:hypothetical protein